MLASGHTVFFESKALAFWSLARSQQSFLCTLGSYTAVPKSGPSLQPPTLPLPPPNSASRLQFFSMCYYVVGFELSLTSLHKKKILNISNKILIVIYQLSFKKPDSCWSKLLLPFTNVLYHVEEAAASAVTSPHNKL